MRKFIWAVSIVIVVASACLILRFWDQHINAASPMAQSAAAIQLNQETLWSIIFSLVSTGALVVTVSYSAVAAKAASKAADAALIAVEHNKVLSVSELRPYLSPESQASRGVFESGSKEKIGNRFARIIWKNQGKTPAINACSSSSITFFEGKEMPLDYNYPDTESHPIAVGIVGPNGTINTNTNYIPFNMLKKVSEDSVTFLHVYAWVEYEGLDPRFRYRTECHYYGLFNGKNLEDPEGYLDFYIADGFWGMDGGCLRKPAAPFAKRRAEYRRSII